MRTREYLEIKRRIDSFELSESLARTRLIRGAMAGDLGALTLLRERYCLRLPLVEDRLKLQIPMYRSTRN
jgi:hypothetical protein